MVWHIKHRLFGFPWFLSKLRLVLCFLVLTIVRDASLPHTRYLNIDELVVEDIIWVDEVKALQNATCRIEERKVVGLDCEWKPNYVKGSKPNKVVITDFHSISLCAFFLYDKNGTK